MWSVRWFLRSFTRSKCSKNSSRWRNRFGQKIVKIQAILAIFRLLEDFCKKNHLIDVMRSLWKNVRHLSYSLNFSFAIKWFEFKCFVSAPFLIENETTQTKRTSKGTSERKAKRPRVAPSGSCLHPSFVCFVSFRFVRFIFVSLRSYSLNCNLQ